MFTPTCIRYLPGYTSFLHNYEDPYSKARERDNSRRLLKDWVFSQLSYLAIFLMLICITEREAMTTDPLNFNVFSILFEIVRQVTEIRCIFQIRLWLSLSEIIIAKLLSLMLTAVHMETWASRLVTVARGY